MQFLLELIMNYTLLYNYSAITSDVLSGIPYQIVRAGFELLGSSYFNISHSYPRAAFAACNLSKVVSPAHFCRHRVDQFPEEVQDGEERDEYQRSVKNISFPSKLQRKRTRKRLRLQLKSICDPP